MDVITDLVLMVLLILLSAFFSSAEVALLSIPKTRVEFLVEHKKGIGSRKLKALKDDQENALITILIGNNLVNIGAAAYATSLAIAYFGNWGTAIATGAMTLLILTFGEIVPKTIAVSMLEQYSLLMSIPLYYLKKALWPAVYLFKLLNNCLRKYFIRSKEFPSITEEELEALIEIGAKEGEVRKIEKEIIVKTFEFGDTTTKEIMTPRVDMFALEENKTIKELLERMEKKEVRHSRIPIYKEDVDHVTGMIYIKDIMDYVIDNKLELKLKDVARKILFAPDTKRIDLLLKEMQREKIQLCIVLDEHGGISGLVTLEDILEELVGEIYDEHEIEEMEIIRKGKNTYIISGNANLEAVAEETGVRMKSEESDTFGGFIVEKIGRIPRKGDRIESKDYIIVVEKGEDKRVKIARLKVKKNAD